MPVFSGTAAENFRPGRPAGFTPDSIVLHRSGGTLASWRERFGNRAAGVSAHYLVARDGTIERCVLETDTAFHAGVAREAIWRLLRPGVNPNFHTIGIELEGGAADDWPEAQLDATARLVDEVARRWRIAVDLDHVVPHRVIRPASGCPAANFPIGRILTARGVDGERPSAVVRTRTPARLRLGSPSLDAPVVRILAAGSDLIVSEVTDAGESVSGNPFWYGDGRGQSLWAGATNVPRPSDDPVLSTLRSRPRPAPTRWS